MEIKIDVFSVFVDIESSHKPIFQNQDIHIARPPLEKLRFFKVILR